ncbi:hypothetical protein ACFSHQ_01890 [Gemmobacter lanyuensis]
MTKTIVPGSAQTAPYVDWAAILAGAVIATALASLAVPFGAALGLSAISAERGEGSFDVGVILTGLWLVISTMASYLVGGYVAGRMRRRGDTASTDEIMARDGVNGLVVWGLGILVTAWMAAGALGTAATTAGQAVGGAASGVVEAAGNALGAAAQGAAATLDGDDGEAAIDWISDQLCARIWPKTRHPRPNLQRLPTGASLPGKAQPFLRGPQPQDRSPNPTACGWSPPPAD